jgi:23S rRNA pseudouridine2605 synthase
MIREGRVSVDGVTVTELGTQADAATQKIAVDGRPIPVMASRRLYIALHKPRGYASTLSDPHAARVISQLVDLPGKPLLRPVGRLDIESEGLIFLSDDGTFINRITHPRYHVPKTYLATVTGEPNAEDIERLRKGILLDDGWTKPSEARMAGAFPASDTSDVEIILFEGRNRQVRRMFSAIGHPVLRLVRTRIGTVTVKGLPSGAWRHLTATEVERLTTANPASTPAPPKGASQRPRRRS